MAPLTPESPLHKSMTTHLSRRQANSSLRSLTLQPKTSIDFSSNDFLSLADSSILRTTFLNTLSQTPNFRLGSTGSRLLDGNSPYAEDLEREIAAFHNAPSALLFNSGFDANAGFFACVPQKGDFIVYDEFIHASVHEGMRVSRVSEDRRRGFRHNCLESLRACLEDVRNLMEHEGGGKNSCFVAVESLYSMDGDLAPLTAIVELVEELFPNGNAHIIVDEAHSTGIYGAKGRGMVCELGLEDRIFARLHTFGKALACNGAILLCDKLTRSYLINYARPLIYTTFMSFPSLAAIKAGYSLLQSGASESRARKLQGLIRFLFVQLQTLSLGDSDLLRIPDEMPKSPIFSILSPRPKDLAKWCQEDGFVVRAIVSPTVPVGTERVRVCLHAENTVEEIDRLVGRMQQWVIISEKKSLRESRL